MQITKAEPYNVFTPESDIDRQVLRALIEAQTEGKKHRALRITAANQTEEIPGGATLTVLDEQSPDWDGAWVKALLQVQLASNLVAALMAGTQDIWHSTPARLAVVEHNGRARVRYEIEAGAYTDRGLSGWADEPVEGLYVNEMAAAQ